eukprot:c24941_g1_i3 orf=165-1976(+)
MKGHRADLLPKAQISNSQFVIQDFSEEEESDVTGSTASFDRFSFDLLGEGSFFKTRGDTIYHYSSGNESRSTSVESSPLGWPLGWIRERFEVGTPCYPKKIENTRYPFVRKERLVNTDPAGVSEVELMKERFAKLLLGEDVSGGGKGVCAALAISNAITNVAASVFGDLWRLEPLPQERKVRWRREMEWLLAVSDYIVEFVPSCQVSDGSMMEVMITRPRSDLQINLPALRKLDAMLLASLDSFIGDEVWYTDRTVVTTEKDRAFCSRHEEKWWLPIPQVPSGGLSENARKQLQHQRECINQILKAALAINGQVLSEIEVPNGYWETLPKNGRSSLGEALYHIITSDNFSPEDFISSLDFANEHHKLELVNRVEAAMHIWHRKVQARQAQMSQIEGRSTSKISGGDLERREDLAERAESLLFLLRQKFPGLPQTLLDVNKIQYNKDVGKSILESYSRVLESLASNIIFRIDDVLHIDNLTKCIRPSTDISKTSTNELAFVRVSSSSVLSREDCKADVAHSESLVQSICSVQCTDAFPDESLSSVQHSPRKKLSDLIGWKHKVSEFHEKPDSNIPGKSVISGWPKKPCSYMENIVAVQSPPSRD